MSASLTPFVTDHPLDQTEIETVAAAIERERRRRSLDAIRMLWRIGDALTVLRNTTPRKRWRMALRTCAQRVDMSAAYLYESVRAADAFPDPTRESLLRRFEDAGISLTVSHLIELARATPCQRTGGIGLLLQTPSMQVRQLRAALHAAS